MSNPAEDLRKQWQRTFRMSLVMTLEDAENLKAALDNYEQKHVKRARIEIGSAIYNARRFGRKSISFSLNWDEALSIMTMQTEWTFDREPMFIDGPGGKIRIQ